MPIAEPPGDGSRNPWVSVLVPVFNAGDYLRPMLDSVRGQRHRPLQLVLVDDGSTDGSRAKAEAWARSCFDASFRVEVYGSERNQGLAATVSLACARATGRYVALADQDDLWDPEKLVEQIAVLERDGRVALVFCDRRLIDSRGRILCPSEYAYAGFTALRASQRDLLAGKGRYSANTMVLRAAAMARLLPIPAALTFHDFYLALAASELGDATYLHRPLVDYRIHATNLSGNYAMELARDFAFFRAGLRRIRANRHRLRTVDALVLAERFNHSQRLRLWEPNHVDRVPAIAQYYYWKLRGRVGRFAKE